MRSSAEFWERSCLSTRNEAVARWCSRFIHVATWLRLTKVDRHAGFDCEVVEIGDLLSSIHVTSRASSPRSVFMTLRTATAKLIAERSLGMCSGRVSHVDRSTATGRASTTFANNEITLQASRRGPIVDLGQILTDHHLVGATRAAANASVTLL